MHASLLQRACLVSDFASFEANACGGFVRSCFSLRNNILTKGVCVSRTWSVGPLLDSQQTYTHQMTKHWQMIS